MIEKQAVIDADNTPAEKDKFRFHQEAEEQAKKATAKARAVTVKELEEHTATRLAKAVAGKVASK